MSIAHPRSPATVGRALSRAAVLASLLLAVGCANRSAGNKTTGADLRQPSVVLDAGKVIAQVDGVDITAGELDKDLVGELDQAGEEFITKVHDLRAKALDQLVIQKAAEKEAAKRGITADDLFKEEVQQKVLPPSDADVQAFYDRVVKGRYDVPLEEAKPQIVMQLTQQAQQERARTFFAELRAAHNIVTRLPAAELPKKDVAATGPSTGPEKAPVTIIEFSDFECPFCSRAKETVDEVMKKNEGKVRLVFRNYPLPFHKNAKPAAQAALCANEQGKFWQMHDHLFAHQDALDAAGLKAAAGAVGLDAAKFDECMQSGRTAATVDADMKDGQKVGVSGTPAFFINGRMLSGAQPAEAFQSAIDEALAAAK